MSGLDAIAELRRQLAPHGYTVFLVPARPSGWTIVLTGPRLERPLEVRAATREEALGAAARLFRARRLQDLDDAIRAAGKQPPTWHGTDEEHLDQLLAFTREQGIPA